MRETAVIVREDFKSHAEAQNSAKQLVEHLGISGNDAKYVQ